MLNDFTLLDIRLELARKSFWDFCHILEPDFYTPDKTHLITLCNTLEDFHFNKLLKDSGEPYTKIIIRFPPQHGKQLSLSEPIMTTKGWKNHGDLKIGDYVFSPNGKPVKVLDYIPQNELCDVEIGFSNGEKIKCHRNHEWQVYKYRNPEIKTFDSKHFIEHKLNSGIKGQRGSKYYYKLQKHKCLEYNNSIIHIDPYLLGAWLGDGKSNGGYLTLNKTDFDFILKRYDINEHKEQPTTRNASIKGFRIKLKESNLIDNKHIPVDYIYTSKENRLQLLAGLIDTDGSLDKNSGQFRFVNANKRIIDGVKTILTSLGITYSEHAENPTGIANSYGITQKQICYTIAFTQNVKIPTKLIRKQSDKYVEDRRVSIVSARWLNDNEKVKGNCITVEGGIYLAGKRMLPTHNSRTLVNFTKWALGLNVNERIITASNTDSQATDFSRYTRDGIMEVKNMPDQIVYSDIFPNTKIKRGDSAVQKWALEGQHFNYLGVGVRGIVTGKGATLRIIDDIVKDAEQALSDTAMDKIWVWLTGTFSSRNSADEGEVKEIFCATLWGERDPQYRLLETEPDDWYVLSMPAYNADTDEMLCSSVLSKKAFLKLKKRMFVDSRTKMIFYANYMAVAIEDSEQKVFQDSSIKRYKTVPTEIINDKEVMQGWTFSFADTADEGSDNFAMPILQVVGNYVYLLDAIFDQQNLTIQESQVKSKTKEYKIRKIVVETNAAGAYFKRRLTEILKGVEMYGQWSKSNKMSRIISMAGIIKLYFLFPENPNPTTQRYMNQVFKLLKTSKKEDDAPDSLAGATAHLEAHYGMFTE